MEQNDRSVTQQDAEQAVKALLLWVGEDPAREGLLDTPKRVCKALREMTCGYGLEPAAVLKTTFTDACDEMVVLRDIDFHSTCEHHLLPFSGVAHVGYIPKDRVVGLSKLARVVDVFARRLQIQERMTRQIADAIQSCLNPLGVGVVVAAEHSCMRCRGVGKAKSQMVTSALLGALREQGAARSEFLSMILRPQ